jgi:glutamine cyclotransferase
MFRPLLAAAILSLVGSSLEISPQRQTRTPVQGYRVVRSFPHDPASFTQGLIFRDGVLYEGTGLKGQSAIRKVRLETGEVLQQRALEARYFGEGIAEWNDTIVQLTWETGIGFVYDRASFALKRTFTYTGEGWGLTQDGSRLIMSDGSATLRFLDPATLREAGRLVVREGATPVLNLNELEFVRGEIFANVWQTDRIVRIDPRSGHVRAVVDLTGPLPASERARVDVLNGIAYDPEGNRLFVTGKLWPRLYEIEIVEPPETRHAWAAGAQR